MFINFILPTLLIRLVISANQSLPAIYGPVITEIGAIPVFIRTSADGMILLVNFRQEKASEVYANTGYGFQLEQSLSGELNTETALTRSGSKLICETRKQANLYQLIHRVDSKTQAFIFSALIGSFEFS